MDLDSKKHFSLKKWVTNKINRKFIFIFSIIFLITLSNVILVYNLQSSQKSDGALIDAAGRNRMLSQRIGYYSEMVAKGHEEDRAPLLSFIELHHTSFYALKDGGIAPGIADNKILPPAIPSIMPTVLKAEELWLEYKEKADIIANEVTFINGTLNPKIKSSLDFLEDNSPEMLRRNNEIAAAYVKINEGKQVVGNITSLIMFVITVIILLFGFVVSKSISKPIQHLYLATKKIGQGDYTSRVDVKTGDELEELGLALNKTTEALAQVEKERKQIDSAKTRFISITSHELRSPMTPMKAQLQMLEGEYFGKISKKQKEAVQTVIRNANRLDKIIVDFLEVSRIEAARLKFIFKKVSLTQSVNQLLKFMEGFMPEKKVKIIGHIDNLPIIEVDPDRVDQVLRNLINNAIKFSPDNGQVVVTAKKKENYIQFSVTDQGVGLKLEDQRRIFEPFYQAEQTIYRKKGGTGLGLAICRGIVEAQNGKLWLESEVGKGSTFYFTLPLIPVKEIKAIKLLFSSQENVELEFKKLFLEILGPMGENEFNVLKRLGLSKDTILSYVKEIQGHGIINNNQTQNMILVVEKFFGKDVSAEIRNLYLKVLGPMGEKQLNKLPGITTKDILGDINILERNHILTVKEASDFRDNVLALFEKRSSNNRLDKKVAGKEIIEAGFVKNNIGHPRKLKKSKTK